MIKIEKQLKQTKVEISGYDNDLKDEIVAFLECLENLMPNWELNSLKEDVDKIDFDRE